MPYVEDELILREIEHLVKGERKLDHAEIGGEVAAAARTPDMSSPRSFAASSPSCFMFMLLSSSASNPFTPFCYIYAQKRRIIRFALLYFFCAALSRR